MHFVYPPRPRGKIDSGNLPEFEATGNWVAQWKYNGTRNLIYVEPDRSIRLYERNGKPHKQYRLSEETRLELLALNLKPGLGYVLDSELLHAKTTDIKDTMVLYDVLWAGEYLFGTSVKTRLDLLTHLCHNPTQMEPTGRALLISSHLWLAPTFTSGFSTRFAQTLSDNAREGLVLKQPKGVLKSMGGSEYEVSWQLRARKPHIGGIYRR